MFKGLNTLVSLLHLPRQSKDKVEPDSLRGLKVVGLHFVQKI